MTTKQRKPVEVLRVPLNCLVLPETKELLTGIQNQTGESQGQVIDRLVSGRAIKVSKRERMVSERASGDIIAQQVGRSDIDYSDIDSTPTTHVATLGVTAPPAGSTTGKASIQSWRATRKPLLKPSQR